MTLPLCRVKETLTAMGYKNMHCHILRHLVDQSGIDKARQWNGPWISGVAQKAVNAGPQRNHRLQIGQGLEKSGLGMEAAEIRNIFKPVRVTICKHAFETMRRKPFLADSIPARRQPTLEQNIWISQR
jgi:hypothetical protein